MYILLNETPSRLQNGDDQLPGKLNARSAFVDFDDYAESDADEEFDPELEFLGEGAARAEQAGSHFRPRIVFCQILGS